jgi:hypothetical protein
MMKKLVSLLLALVMALGLCSGVWAENTDPVDDQESNQQESGPVWPEGAIHLEFYENGEYYNGKGVDPGASVTFDALYVDRQHNTAITGFSVSNETSAGLNAVVTVGGKLNVTAKENCEPGDKFVILMIGATKYALRLNVNKVGGDHGGGPKWPTTEQFCFNGTDNDGKTSFFNGTGIDQGGTVTFEKIFKDDNDHMQITSFAVDKGLTSKGLTATANGEALTVTIAEDCELGEQFVVIVADNTKYSMCFNVRKAGGNQGGGDQGGDDGPGGGEDRRTGTVTDPNTLENETTKKYLADYINYEGTGGQFTIKNAEIDAKTGLYKDEAARQAAIAAYNAFCSLGPNADGLYSLYVKNSRGQECWFYERMEELRQLADNGSGSYTDTDAFNAKLRAAGYVAPVLGRDLKVEFPYQLVRGTDYDYTYDQSNGHLIITIEKGEAQNWLSAAEGIYFTMDSVMVNMTLMNTSQKSGYAFWSGIGEGGTWNQFVDGSVKSTYPEESMQSFGYGDRLAPVNRDGDKISVTSSSDNKTYRVLMVWGDENEAFENRTKWLFTYEIKVEESFYYSKAGVSNVGKVEMDRVDTSALGNNWTVDNSEEGVLKLVPKTEVTGEEIGTVTVTAPTGYTFDRDSSYAANGNDNSLNGTQTGANKCNISLYNQYRNTFVLVWKNDTKVIQESLDVYRLDEQLENLGKYDADGKTVESGKELPVTKPKAIAAAGSASGVTVEYDASTGSFYTTFDKSKSLPSYKELQKGVLLEPDSRIKSEVTHFRAVTQSTGDQVGHSKEDVINLVQGMCAMGENLTYSYTDTQDNSWRTLPYVDTDYQEIGGIQVSYAADQGYRYKIVQWLRKEDNGTYTVLGYSYVWGRNDAFINEIQTSGVAAGSVAAGNEPFVIGEGMQLRCDRYPQYGGDGKIQYFQFRAYGDHEGDYIIYIPYEYFDMEKDDGLALRDRGQRPRINHYYEDHTLRETITGEYTEYGVKFTTGSFSPFVVDCSEQSTGGGYYYGGASTPGISAVKTADAAKSATDYTSGIYGLTFRSTAAFSGFKGVQVDGRTIAAANYVAEDNGGIEVYLKAVYLRTLKDGRHTVTILSDAGNVTMNFTIGGVDSPTTFDAGIGAYVSMALASVGGMAWMRRRKR